MAVLIPSRSQCLPRMNRGERRFALRLEDKLEDDYWVWYDLPVGPKQRQPDFVILHPNRGLLILEVKDWSLDALKSLDKFSASLLTDRGLVTVANPLAQARVYAIELTRVLETDAALRHPPGHAHAGKLLVPWGHGVVLAQISRRQFLDQGLDEVLPPQLCICQDEMQENIDSEVFQQRLWAMFQQSAGRTLSLPQLDRIRWHLFPEIRVQSPLQTDIFSDPAATDALTEGIPDLVRVMDLQQEQLARSLGDGHRVIHGVAGSGKTMILGFRCLHLARLPGKPVLVLCYNKTLAARLQQIIVQQDLRARVDIRNFHAWCADMLRAYNVPSPRSGGDPHDYFAAQVQAVISGVEHRSIPRGQYAAVLIDEGHDFEPEWLKLIVQMVDPAHNALLLLCDDAQSIYAGRRRRFSFSSVGIEARGRTTILKLNYRNTHEILQLAKAFAGHLLDAHDADEDLPPMIGPESVGRHGAPPQLIQCASVLAEAETVAAHIADAQAQGVSLQQIAVIYRHWGQASAIAAALLRRGIAYRTAFNASDKQQLFAGDASVKFITMHSSKGLEFEYVFIPGLGAMPGADASSSDEARLLYVAMTRATEHLVGTHVGRSAFVEKWAQCLSA